MDVLEPLLGISHHNSHIPSYHTGLLQTAPDHRQVPEMLISRHSQYFKGPSEDTSEALIMERVKGILRSQGACPLRGGCASLDCS